MNYASYRGNRLMGIKPDALRRFCFAEADAFEAMYRAERRCNDIESGFDALCNRFECHHNRQCRRIA